MILKETTDYPLSGFDWWLPRGLWLSDDLQAVMSPDLYREFAIPYNEMLAQEFGGWGPIVADGFCITWTMWPQQRD